jgi:FKBP-type peptidyl-prolyl cis-trans isomerase
MQKLLFPVLLLFILLINNKAKSQTGISIPAFTAYALPVDESNEDDESKMFSIKEGLHNWKNSDQQIQFFFKIRNIGELQLSLLLKTNVPGNSISVSIAGKDFTVTVPKSESFKTVQIGTVNITDTGFYSVTISSNTKKTGNIADISSLELSGEATKNIHFNAKSRRNAASVHLVYPVPDSLKVLSFYNEITIPKGSDGLHSYFMACGFARGYFGIQVNSSTERRVIFSVWDAGNEAVDRNKVADENKVQLLAKGEDVFADGFGNEGTGGHSHWVYNWKTEETYRFLVTAITDSASNTTTYTGYFFLPELQKWKLIAAFKAPKDGKPLRKLYSFVENFWGVNGQLYRQADFGNQWIRKENGDWIELTTAKFSFDATGKAGDRIDYGAGTVNNKFYLWNGGFKEANAKYNDEFSRKSNSEKPVIDLYKNADSLIESKKENEMILSAIQNGKFDTTGSKSGVYYKILKEGNGDMVSVNDTLVVHYKGQLLNGFVFDETRDKPAVFPLKRLIKGWQIGLPFCKQGGKIRLIIPSALAYSIRNLGLITPNSILVFDVEVVGIKKP